MPCSELFDLLKEKPMKPYHMSFARPTKIEWVCTERILYQVGFSDIRRCVPVLLENPDSSTFLSQANATLPKHQRLGQKWTIGNLTIKQKEKDTKIKKLDMVADNLKWEFLTGLALFAGGRLTPCHIAAELA
jgi:hypothetical protein